MTGQLTINLAGISLQGLDTPPYDKMAKFLDKNITRNIDMLTDSFNLTGDKRNDMATRLALGCPIAGVKGVGPVTAKFLEAHGIVKLIDLFAGQLDEVLDKVIPAIESVGDMYGPAMADRVDGAVSGVMMGYADEK